MAAAEALLVYEPLQHLKHENFLLREENRRVQSEVRELLAWKDKAVAHMTAMAPARQRASCELERAKQLRQKLCTVKSSLKSRSALELATTKLKSEREGLERRVEKLERELAALKSQIERKKRRAEDAEAQFAAIGESFRLHLEQLMAMRNSFDDVSNKTVKDSNKKEEMTDSAMSMDNYPSDNIKLASGNQEQIIEAEEGDTDSSSSDSLTSAALVTGLTTVASKCIWWLEEQMTQTFIRLQRKAARYESEHKEVKRLKELVQTAGRIPIDAAVEHTKQTLQLVELREAHKLLQQRVTDAENEISVQRQHKMDMAIRLRFVANEVRQYLRLVRGEIKRKFGYLPEAIAHAESWARIAEALELLLCQSRDRREILKN